MIPITDVAVGFLMAWQAAVSPGQTALVGRPDSLPQPRAATVMGLLEEARLARLRGFKVAQNNGSVQTALGRIKDWLVGNF